MLGGTHATCTYKDSIKYADSIVVGEAEVIFPQLIDDFLTKKKLRKIYKNKNFVDLEKLPTIIPAYDLINLNRYYRDGLIRKSNHFQIEASRGCPMNCTFCTVKVKNGSIQRFKTISSVIDEIRFLKENYNARFFSFSDDNFLHNLERSKNLLKAISNEGMKFVAEISARIIDKPELIPLLKKAGCVTAFIGVESLNMESLRSVKKIHNKVQEYKEIFSLFNKYNIPVFPAFIFGFDYDDENVFSDVFQFLKSVNTQRAVFSILTPFPGTPLYRQFKKEKKIVTDNLSLYDVVHVVFQPNKLTKGQLQKGYWWLYQKYYSIKEISYRLFNGGMNALLYSLIVNLRIRNFVYKKIYPYNSGVKRII